MIISHFGYEGENLVLKSPVPGHIILFFKFNVMGVCVCVKGGRALSPFFGLPRKPKIESYFTTLSLD